MRKMRFPIQRPVTNRQIVIAAVALTLAVTFDEIISRAGFGLAIQEVGLGPTWIATIFGEHAVLPWRWLITATLLLSMISVYKKTQMVAARFILTKVGLWTTIAFLTFSVANSTYVLLAQYTDQIIKLLETVRNFFVRG